MYILKVLKGCPYERLHKGCLIKTFNTVSYGIRKSIKCNDFYTF